MTITVPGIWDMFKLFAETTGASFSDADDIPLLESTAIDYPGLRMSLRARGRDRLTGPANGFATKIKWRNGGAYDSRTPLTPLQFARMGSIEYLSSNYCHEAGTLMVGKDEVERQGSGVYDATSMRQKFDDVLTNNKQDFYVDVATKIEETFWEVPDPIMEQPQGNRPRSFFAGCNEWKQAHGTVADGMFPGITTFENYDPTKANGLMGSTVQTYDTIGAQDGLQKGHLFQAFTRGLRNVNFSAVPLAESLTQGTEGQRECLASLEGILLLNRTLAAHDNMVAEEGAGNALSLVKRFKDLDFVDVVGMENMAICPDYDGNGDPVSTAANAYDATAERQSYSTELTSANARGPRFYVPYQPHMRMIWDENNFMTASEMYELDQTIPDALVMYLFNYRNLHWQSFRRNLVIRPNADISGFAA